ncbi:MAG: hypothetical protein J1E95_11250 [Muribaculaceae bacterium]|nr:hypothetical protein [Muribaculaceae bacterium]
MSRNNNRPYDAEIEYLEVNESTEGCPYIDTGLILNGHDYIIDIDILINGRTQPLIGNPTFVYNETLIGPTGAKYGLRYAGGNSDVGVLAYCGHNGSGWVLTTFKTGERILIKIDGIKQLLYANGLQRVRLNSTLSTLENYDPIRIFSSDSENLSFFKIFSVKISGEDEKEIIDLIPVRKGDEGFLYDRVSGKLFGNSGSGRFILGPDIS